MSVYYCEANGVELCISVCWKLHTKTSNFEVNSSEQYVIYFMLYVGLKGGYIVLSKHRY